MKCAYCNGVMPETRKLARTPIKYFNAPFCRPSCAIIFAKALYKEGYRIAATSNQVTRV